MDMATFEGDFERQASSGGSYPQELIDAGWTPELEAEIVGKLETAFPGATHEITPTPFAVPDIES